MVPRWLFVHDSPSHTRHQHHQNAAQNSLFAVIEGRRSCEMLFFQNQAMRRKTNWRPDAPWALGGKNGVFGSKCYEKSTRKKFLEDYTSRNISFTICILIFVFQMIPLRDIVYIGKQLFPFNLKFVAIEISGNIVHMFHYSMEID